VEYYANCFSLLSERCFRMIQAGDGTGHTQHCPYPTVWRGRFQDKAGKWHTGQLGEQRWSDCDSGAVMSDYCEALRWLYDSLDVEDVEVANDLIPRLLAARKAPVPEDLAYALTPRGGDEEVFLFACDDECQVCDHDDLGHWEQLKQDAELERDWTLMNDASPEWAAFAEQECAVYSSLVAAFREGR
jgi:hypothetical protein